MRGAHTSFPCILLLVLISTCSILHAGNQVVSSATKIYSSGKVEYNPTPAVGWLHTDGIWVKDSADRTLAWRGIIFEYQSVTQNVIDFAKAYGATYIELGFVPDRPYVEWYLDVYNPTHLSKLDNAIDICESSGVYVILSCLDSSSNRVRDGLATGWQDAVPINAFKVLVQRYAGRPAVTGIKFLDEPHFNSATERQMYYNAINALKPLNPNLLWVCHLITYIRFAHLDGTINSLNPWQSIDQVPDNVLIDAGCWIGQAGGEFTFPKDDYASADKLVADVIQRISNFQKIVPIPAGMAYGCAAYREDCSWTYAMREINRQLDANHMITTYILSAYLLRDMQSICDRIMPDSPYSQYW